jgi:hypothetical protein
MAAYMHSRLGTARLLRHSGVNEASKPLLINPLTVITVLFGRPFMGGPIALAIQFLGANASSLSHKQDLAN